MKIALIQPFTFMVSDCKNPKKIIRKAWFSDMDRWNNFFLSSFITFHMSFAIKENYTLSPLQFIKCPIIVLLKLIHLILNIIFYALIFLLFLRLYLHNFSFRFLPSKCSICLFLLSFKLIVLFFIKCCYIHVHM